MHAETPRLADKIIVFSEHKVFKVVVTIIVLRIFLKMKNPLKISLLITKLSIPKHIYVRYVIIIRNISFNLTGKIQPQTLRKTF
jgi:hypothetical protein